MAQGIMMEWEWRKQAQRSARRRNRCWGPQCLVSKPAKKTDRRLFAGLLAASVMIAALLPLLYPPEQARETFQTRENVQHQSRSSITARSLSTVNYSLPEGMEAEKRTFTREEMLRGKMLYLDEQTRIPMGVPMPNTMSVAGYGKGMVPVSDLSVRSGQETIRALTGLFAALRGAGVSCFAVCHGTMTPLEQKQQMLNCFLEYAKGMPLEEAALKTLAEMDEPGCGSMTQEYAVELCLASSPDAEKTPLEESPEGRTLLQTAWRYGFILEKGENRWRLRYVGQAHAAAMVFLDLDMKDYLLHLHERGIIQVRLDADTTCIILCQPMEGEYVEFLMPKGARWEVSHDNMGYGLAACVIEH
ncbi:MAG: D-alanyl-D-alanine carboxypeptidase family protein [Clostridiales bacterium]|nr:D-alanyl-D-alanine carboxypeptidase family protein [Clostridiales bacterium]